MKKINFIVAAYNEELRICEVINSIKAFADQIIILDPGSSDLTNQLAQETFPVKICKVDKNMFNIEARVNSAFDIIREYSKNDWFLYLNCSEYMPEDLGKKLIDIINKKEVYGINFYRQSFTFGIKTHRRKLLYILNIVFKFKNNFRLIKYSYWDQKNSKMHCEFPIKKIYLKKTISLKPSDILALVHRRYGNIKDFELKHSVYSQNEAQERFDLGQRTNILRLLFLPAFVFLYFLPICLFSKKNLIVSTYHAFYKFQVETKLYFLGLKHK